MIQDTTLRNFPTLKRGLMLGQDGFFDLNIRPSYGSCPKDLIERLKEFNFKTVALDLHLASQDQLKYLLPKFDSFFKNFKNLCENGGIKCLRRITIDLYEKLCTKQIKDLLKTFDLISFCPMNEISFLDVCHRTDFDILSLNSNVFSGFKIKKNLDLAVNQGIFIEIEYSKVLQDDIREKIYLFSHVYSIMRRCRKVRFIFSSGAATPENIRTPFDVLNLAVMCGLNPHEAMDSLVKNSKMAAIHGFTRNSTINGIFEVMTKELDCNLIETSETVDLKRKNIIEKADEPLSKIIKLV